MDIEQYSDIAPYSDDVFQENMAKMVADPGFEHAIRFVFPDVDYQKFTQGLIGIDNHYDFQSKVMLPFIQMLEQRTTAGISQRGDDNIHTDTTYTFITNHRDIVLDATFLNYCLFRSGKGFAEVAIGNNLLIYDWINHLVKLNQSFIVKRNLRMIEALKAAKQLSGYIHYCLSEKHKSVWIAQREGRTKDSNDMTQESLIKMISLEGGGDVLDNLLSARLMPVAISYELDPNDYLKAKEFLMKRRDPAFKKSQRDDLFSMETGLLGYKGRVNFTFGKCINDALAGCVTHDADRTTIIRDACTQIDREIHLGYEIYPINYIAYDKVKGTPRFAENYTEADLDRAEDYIQKQLAKVDLPDLTHDDYDFMRQKMLEMYANPLINKLRAQGQ